MKNQKNDKLKEIQTQLPFLIEEDKLIALSLSISRIADKKITKHINNFKIEHKIQLSSFQKKNVRDYILGLEDWQIKTVSPIDKNIFDEKDILSSLDLLDKGIKRNKEKVIGTINSRLNKGEKQRVNNLAYLKIIKDYEKNKNQLLIIDVEKEESNIVEKIKSIIDKEYKNLANYHSMAIIFRNNDWKTIYEIAIYCEFFRKEKEFGVFNKKRKQKIEELTNFIKNNKNIIYSFEIEKKIKDFFSEVSYGFQFNDLMISDKDNTKILILQKIELDETILPCPDCMKNLVRGNSYPKLLQRSFECQNPNCPSRSKIGRGKRYDYLNVKRNTYIALNNKEDLIDKTLLKDYRKDIFSTKGNLFDMLIQFFSWPGEKIKYINSNKERQIKKFYGREINIGKFKDYNLIKHEELLFKSLLNEIIKNINLTKEKPSNKVIKNEYSIYEGDSSTILKNIKEKISGVITSPPYYNAREYSQWPTFLCYLIDMAINAKSVLDKMENNTYYFYNIGDIVGQENIFVSSHMSNRRLMLGFYSILIFEMVGYKLIDNLIWNKGEVQSKRNSTENIFPSYIKPINCYEHVLIFGKNVKKINFSKKIFSINAVKKINSKGKNILGHTAPYPEEIAGLIFPFLEKNKGYLLDPYLGSGTTVIAGYKKGYKTVGIEYNKDYFKLANERIKNSIKESL